MSAHERIEARLTLFGFTPTPAELTATRRTRSERVLRAAFAAIATALVVPIVFLIPPHIEWVVLTVLAGSYWTRKHWIAELVVDSLAAICPACHKPVAVKPGTSLRLPHSVVCYACHQHPALELGATPPVDAARLPRREQAPLVEERRPVKIWSPAGSDW